MARTALGIRTRESFLGADGRAFLGSIGKDSTSILGEGGGISPTDPSNPLPPLLAPTVNFPTVDSYV